MNVRLLVLGLLQRQPMHGYELRRLAAESRIESWAGVLPGSIYHALKTMEREGLVAPIKRGSGGPRARSVYSITPAGRQALLGLVRESLEQPIRSFPTHLYGGLMYLEMLPRDEVDAAVARQIDELQSELAHWIHSKPKKKPASWENDVLFESGIEHMRVDLRLLERLRERRVRNRRKASRS